MVLLAMRTERLKHCYQTPSLACPADIRKRVETHLGGAIEGDMSIRLVRDVAPNKRMMRVSFRVPEAVAFSQDTQANSEQDDLEQGNAERNSKRLKSSNE